MGRRRQQQDAFTTSRAGEFLSEKELVAQAGAHRGSWPVVVVRELIDNALDAAEEIGVTPSVHVDLQHDSITIADHGPGIEADTVRRITDFTTRTSSREAWVAPTRGRQGNALPVVLGIAHVVGGEVEIASQGCRHRIAVIVDDLRREPRALTVSTADPTVKNGTIVRVRWPDLACFEERDETDQILSLAGAYQLFNPHLTLNVAVEGEERLEIEPTRPDWPKWRPGDPSPPHWFDDDDLARLIGATLALAEDHGTTPSTVREFVRRFAGLTGTLKTAEVLRDAGLTGARLSDLCASEGRLDIDTIGRLRSAMVEHGRPIKPRALGVIGRDHFGAAFAEMGGNLGSFRYKRVEGATDGVPWLLEAAFAWAPGAACRHAVHGVNWSPALSDPLDLDGLLAERWADPGEPVLVAGHLVHPKVRYTDRGKTRVALETEIRHALDETVEHVTAAWAKQRAAEFRDRQREARRRQALASVQERRTTIKDAAWEVMADAYTKASDGGRLPANARQIYYAARPQILARTGKAQLDSNYFTQTLLPDFMAEHPELSAGWDVVFDARGNAREPHTERTVPLGTLAVRRYLTDVETGAPPPSHVIGLHDLPLPDACPTIGPEHRFGALLYIEKEGFGPLLEATRIAERFDLMIVSGKGQSTTAARTLVDQLAGRFGLPLLIVHDFDKAGLEIASTLSTDTRRYSFDHVIEIHDLGLRLADVGAWDLESEDVTYGSDPVEGLRRAGAGEDEIAFLRETSRTGRRVELNAFTSRDFVAWLEAKLVETGVAKVIPDGSVLATTWRRLAALAEIRRKLPELAAEAVQHAADVDVPADLKERLEAVLGSRRDLAWQDALALVAAHRDGG